MRARRLGIHFQRSAGFELPNRIFFGQNWHSLSLPHENGVLVAFIDILLDDCYGLSRLKVPPRTIVDIGAHVGLFAVAARVRFPHCIIHSYEPNPFLEKHLEVQARAAQFGYSMCAVGASNGYISLDYQEDSVQTRTCPDESGAITQIAFEEVLGRSGGSIDFLKIDCEGAEWDLFSDPVSWQKVRNLAMEYHLWPNHTHDEVSRVLQSLGFSITRQKRSTSTFGILWASRE